MVIKRRVIEKIGNVDEIFELGYFDDVDYSVRAIEAGFLCVKALNVYVHHERNVTALDVLRNDKWNELHEKNKLIYYKKWGRPLKIDIILDNKNACKNPDTLTQIRNAIFYLARQQHRVNVWTAVRLEDKFQHTNVRLKRCNPVFLNLFTFFDLYLNQKKKPEKRYNAVFKYTQMDDFAGSVKETVDRIKKKTKETINVNM